MPVQKSSSQKPLIQLQQIRIISLLSQKSWSNGNINQKLKAATNIWTYIIWNQNIRNSYQDEIEYI